MICWWCYWGWPVEVADIYRRAVHDIDAAMQVSEANDWRGWEGEPISGEHALKWGPAHVVWEDENWDCAASCLADCDSPLFADWHPGALEIVRRSLRELAALPDDIKETPDDYDGEHPERFPPSRLMVKI